MTASLRFLLTASLLFSVLAVKANPDTTDGPKMHFLFNKQIDEAQLRVDMLDRKKDGNIKLTKNPEVNLQIADAIFRKIDKLQVEIERNPKLKTPNEQIRYLVLLKNLLNYYSESVRAKQFDPLYTPLLIRNYSEAARRCIDSLSILPVIQESPWGVARLITDVLRENKEYREARKIVYLKYTDLFPNKILETLSPFAQENFADSLVIIAANRSPGQLYNYASAKDSPVGRLIHASSHPLIKVVAGLSQTPNALLYFPFLDDLIKGRKTIDSIARYVGDGESTYDSVGYFKLLVQTEIAYARRLHAGDTPIAMLGPNGLRDMLRRKDSMHFVRVINDLHDLPEAKRMKAVDLLSSIDLYYVIVLGEDEIYTSSYKHCFTRLIQRMGPKPQTDSLLEWVEYDYFKKFIKMAASFNKLDTFLKLMPPEKAEQLMRSFAGGLENTNNLEDAVDVADSYSSIRNKTLQQNILNYVKENEVKAEARDDERGKTIYNTLRTIFLSTDTSLNPRVDLTATIGIPSIYEIELQNLKDDSQNIVEIMFFYGDDDGKVGFNGFMNSFNRKTWKIVSKPEWMEISPIKNSSRFTIYANKPLNNDLNLDDTAQVHMIEYLRQKQITPSIVVHRGHSYWLPRTIARMPDDAKIIILGSCGGYKNLSGIIKTSPNAHIISSKQIGRGVLNSMILNYVHNNLTAGKTTNWPEMWKQLTKQVSVDKNRDNRESWDDYVPPHRNLGAIFLKAYNRKMQEL